MNNNTNDLDPILDFILQNDNKETNKPISNELLGFLLSDDSSLFPPQQSLQTPQPLLPTITTTATTTTATNASASTTQEVRSPPYKRQRYSSNSNSSPSEEDDEPTDAQLKMMPSKERRQLRNKISARNFRNRRKGNFS
jgi:hypothetical protein